jgi:transcription elongation factor GreA
MAPRDSLSHCMVDLKRKLQEEITALDYELRNELPKEILKARAHGDLRENAEFHAAKERQRFVDARLAQLKKKLADLAMVDMSKIPLDRIGLGSRVLVYDVQKEEKVTYRLVTTEESDVAKGLISTSSPIGRALLGKKVGDEVKIQIPGGVRDMEVLELTTVHQMDT